LICEKRNGHEGTQRFSSRPLRFSANSAVQAFDVADMTTTARTKSREWFARAQRSLIEGVNSPSRGTAVYYQGPVVIEKGRGSRVWDLDGNEYVDFMMSFGATIQGHAHPKIVEP
jgi:4-aminobutyrate aminotransferase-like enzyme